MTHRPRRPHPDPSTAPGELYRHALDLLLAKDIDGWVGLWDEHGVMEFPFAPEGWPRRLEGRAAVAGYMRGYPDHIDLRAIPYLEITPTADPRTIVADLRATGRLGATGEPYEMSYIALVTVVGGLITRYRDYWNPLAVPESARGPRAFAPTAPHHP
ncbi:nuclear transport factor 2 family protein [Streptomyces lichenis]|uniref:Nuclear transport factor 2 family protein n=1 Tax=Streptomyces lichenis TaxID=2306967 RepID=A0ABT0IIK8_9ACTN|nr:nuclear transport factor 2 family protein [Streptomyces lichenis]MCK8681105.1 nuclear transport factor 2 family protein [Streptomyces lichenis]